MEAVCYKRHTVGDVPYDDLHEEEHCRQPQHRKQSAFLAGESSHCLESRIFTNKNHLLDFVTFLEDFLLEFN